MKIVGCDLHARQQTLAMVDTETGEFSEKTIRHEGNAGRVRWVSGTPGKPPAYAGTDFIVARNGRIASVYLFFDSLP